MAGSVIIGIILAVLIFFDAQNAAAWGSAAHLFIANNLINDYLGQLGKISALLYANIDAFFYGNLAPDITIGKKYCNPLNHCHNWILAFSLLEKACGNREKAFVYGYFSHIASDVAAHQYFIRPKLKKNRFTSEILHSIIESKAELMLPSRYTILSKAVINKKYPDLDKLLKSSLYDTLFSFSTSKFLFRQTVNLFPSHEYSSKIGNLFSKKELYNYLALSIDFTKDILINGNRSAILSKTAVISKPAHRFLSHLAR